MTNTFQDILREKLNEIDSYPHTTTYKNSRVVSVLVQAGTAEITLTLKDGSIVETPRVATGFPYIVYCDNPIETVNITGATSFDMELLERGVS